MSWVQYRERKFPLWLLERIFTVFFSSFNFCFVFCLTFLFHSIFNCKQTNTTKRIEKAVYFSNHISIVSIPQHSFLLFSVWFIFVLFGSVLFLSTSLFANVNTRRNGKKHIHEKATFPLSHFLGIFFSLFPASSLIGRTFMEWGLWLEELIMQSPSKKLQKFLKADFAKFKRPIWGGQRGI